ncbi:hypothetical protein [Aureimonas sp. AU40]|uniref:hypothetical protein n=1 Tax=Aureimonas sp. AU40 TaxID=1637747 RepID=UPI000AC0FA0F|nr:hypothetical protein [Aureimonas sp. AU40]
MADRDTLNRSLGALASELDAIERETRWAGLKASSERSAADYEMHDDPASRALAAHHREAAHGYEAKRKALESVRKRLDGIGMAMALDDSAWVSERRTYDSILNRAPMVHVVSDAPAAPPVPEAPPLPLLSECMESYVESVAKDDRGASYVNGLRSKLREFISIVGDKPLANYVPRDLRTFAEGLADLPTNWMKFPAYKGRTAAEVVAMVAAARARGEAVPPCRSETTILGYCQAIAGAFGWLAMDLTLRSPFADVRVKAPRHAPKAVVREPFAVADLNRWFASAVLEDRPDDYWLPLLGTLTGARIGELAYLQGGDIVEVQPGLWAADLSRYLLVNGKDQERQVKNEGSRRLFALHQALTDVGFIRYAKNRPDSDWVFPHLHHKIADPADTASKRQGARLRACGLHNRLSAVFHSSRHTAKDFLRIAKIDPRTSSLQTGHVPQSVEASYGSKRLRADEVEVLAAMALPKDLDLAPYLNSKGPMQVRPFRTKRVRFARTADGE